MLVVKLIIALLSNTSPLYGNTVTQIKLTLLACNVVVKQRKYVPISHTADHTILTLNKSHWRKKYKDK